MANALPVPIHTAFAALFNDASKDPFLTNGSYDAFLAPFHIHTVDAKVMPEVVRQQLAAASNQRLPVAIVLLVDGHLRPYFLPSR